MPRSADPRKFPHTTANSEPPKPGDLVFGEEGLLAVLCVGPETVTGLIISHAYNGVVDIPLGEYPLVFATRVLVQESLEPENRLQ